MSKSAIEKDLEKAEDRADREKDKHMKLVERGMFVGGIFAGAALSAVVDLKFKPIMGIQPSVFMGAAVLVAVQMDWVPRKNEDQLLTLALGMLSPKVAERTKATMVASGMFGAAAEQPPAP